MNIIAVLFLIILAVCYIGCSPYYLNLADNNDPPRKYCGKKLIDALALVCNNKYYSRDVRRFHNDFINYDNEYPIDFDGEDKYDNIIYPFLQKSSSLSLLPNKVRRAHGVSDECCAKSCRLSEMQAYCA